MAGSSQTTQAFPKLDAPIAETQTGNVTQPWNRLLITLWQRVGGSTVDNNSYVYFTTAGGGTINGQSPSGGSTGTIEYSDSAGKPAIPQGVGGSPAIFLAPSAGAFGVESGQVEFSRDNGTTWYIVGLAGGLLPVRAKDQIRVTYYDSAPTVTFFPD